MGTTVQTEGSEVSKAKKGGGSANSVDQRPIQVYQDRWLRPTRQIQRAGLWCSLEAPMTKRWEMQESPQELEANGLQTHQWRKQKACSSCETLLAILAWSVRDMDPPTFDNWKKLIQDRGEKWSKLKSRSLRRKVKCSEPLNWVHKELGQNGTCGTITLPYFGDRSLSASHSCSAQIMTHFHHKQTCIGGEWVRIYRLCGETGTMAHILAACKTTLSQGNYRCQDKVLRVLTDILKQKRQRRHQVCGRPMLCIQLWSRREQSSWGWGEDGQWLAIIANPPTWGCCDSALKMPNDSWTPPDDIFSWLKAAIVYKVTWGGCTLGCIL